MTLRRRFEVLTPLPNVLVADLISDIRVHLNWIKHILDLPNIINDRKAEGVLVISGGRYPVNIKLSRRREDEKEIIEIDFTGTFSMKIIYTIFTEPIGTKVRGDIEISVGFFWERMLKGFIRDLCEHLRSELFDMLKQVQMSNLEKEIKSHETEIKERREDTKEEEATSEKTMLKVRTLSNPDKLTNPVLMAKILSRSELTESFQITDKHEYISKLEGIAAKYGDSIAYVVLKDVITVRALLEKGVLTGLKIEADNKVYDGVDALKSLESIEELKGKLYVFVLKGTMD